MNQFWVFLISNSTVFLVGALMLAFAGLMLYELAKSQREAEKLGPAHSMPYSLHIVTMAWVAEERERQGFNVARNVRIEVESVKDAQKYLNLFMFHAIEEATVVDSMTGRLVAKMRADGVLYVGL